MDLSAVIHPLSRHFIRIKKLILLVILISLIQPLHAQSDGEKLDEVMQAAVRADDFSGVVLVSRHDSILLAKGYGWRDYQHKVPHDTNSVFQIGSVTKQFTATVILWLQEHHQLSVEDKLSTYFPQYAYADKITIKNLLTHSSGIPGFDDAYFLEHQVTVHFSQNDFWDIIRDKALDFDPGTEFHYSNSNYMLLGYIIEKVAGKPYEQMVREVIFNKAGMTHSGFDFAHLKSPYRSVGYDSLNERVQIPARIEDSSASFAAGAIYTTAGDLYRWNLALYTDKIVSQAALQEAFTPHLGNYGYGWFIDSMPGHRYMAHNGGIFGFETTFKRFPADHACIIVLCNELPGLHEYIMSVNQILYGGQGYYIPRKATSIAPDSLSQYTGHYQLTGKSFTGDISLKNGVLWLTWSGDRPYEIFAERKDGFFFKSFNCQLEFKRNANGRISGFTAHTSQQDFPYEKTD